MVNAIISIVLLYAGLAIVFLIHSLVIAPQKKVLIFKNGLPVFKSDKVVNPNTSLIIDALLIAIIYFLKPENLLLQAIILMALIHLVLNALLIPLTKNVKLNKFFYLKTLVITLLLLLTSNYFINIITTFLNNIM